MTDHPIVFVDTETTCLGRHARPWEIAVVRREPDGTETQLVAQVTYTLHNLPEHTHPQALDVGGWLRRGVAGSTYIESLEGAVTVAAATTDERVAAERVYEWLSGAPILVGVGTHFDAAVLSGLFARHDLRAEPWHYAIMDLKSATWGHLRAVAAADGDPDIELLDALRLPMRSEQLAACLGVDPPTAAERHTALGDARWAARWFDALMGGR